MYMVQYLTTGDKQYVSLTKEQRIILQYLCRTHSYIQENNSCGSEDEMTRVQFFITNCVLNDESSNSAFFLLFWQVGTMKRAQ